MHSSNTIWKMPHCNLTLHGRSRAADATSIAIPEWKINLDAGVVVHCQNPSAVFISHTHADHCFRLTHMVSRACPPNFYVPHSTVDLVESYLINSQELTGNCRFASKEDYQTNHITIGIKGGDKWALKHRKNVFVEAFDLDHSVPSLGYGFTETKSCLKKKYVGLTGKEIAAKRKAGEDVTQIVSTPLFAFLGDTTASVFTTTPRLLEFPVIICECSFLEDDDLKHAVEKKHTHWTNLKPHVVNNPNITFVLIHFSSRYTVQFIGDFFEQENVPNVVLLLTNDCQCEHKSVTQVLKEKKAKEKPEDTEGKANEKK